MGNINCTLIIALVLGIIWSGMLLFIPSSGNGGSSINGLIAAYLKIDISHYKDIKVLSTNTTLFLDNTTTTLIYPKTFKLRATLPLLKLEGVNGKLFIGTGQTHIKNLKVIATNLTLDGKANLKTIKIDGTEHIFVKGLFDVNLFEINGLDITFNASLSNVQSIKISGVNVSGDLHLNINMPCSIDISSTVGTLNIYIPKYKRNLLSFNNLLTNIKIIEGK